MKRLGGLVLVFALSAAAAFGAGKNNDYRQYSEIIKENLGKDFKKMYREAGGALPYPFLAPGSEAYADCLWDWDSWLSDIALRQILTDRGNEEDMQEAMEYERGCILNSLAHCDMTGWIPIIISREHQFDDLRPKDPYKENTHKPCLAQHAAFLVKLDGGNAEWLREDFAKMQYFMNGYRTRQYHYETGLYFWINDVMIGVDNDPSTFYRPDRSSGSIFLNCLMYKELLAMSYLAGCLDLDEIKLDYDKWAADLKASIQEHCWDEKDGMFYSVDLNLKPRINDHAAFHQGAQRHWDCVIERIGCWSSFMALWAGIATPEQARRIVDENLLDERTFNAPYGVRTLSKLEKMYNVKASGNPSSWLGPIWGVSNYMTWRGLVNYGMTKEAKDLAAKTVVLFGRDYELNGALHEYYLPENGEPVLNKGFQNWNYLVINMLAWLEGREVVSEF